MEKRKSNKKKIIILAVVIAVVALSVVIKAVSYFGGVVSSVKSMMGIQVQALEKHDLSRSINASGTVESQNVVVVTTEIVSKVKELKVSLGDYVNAGDVLCIFDDTELREQIKELEAQASTAQQLAAKEKEILERTLQQAKDSQTKEVNAASEQVLTAQKNYDESVVTYNEAVSDFAAVQNSGNMSAEQLAEIESGVDAAYASMKELEAILEQTKREYDTVVQSAAAAVQSAQDSVDTNALTASDNGEITKELAKLYRQSEELTVTADQSGIITSLNISQGSIPNGPLMQIENAANLKVNVNIKEKDITILKQGMKVRITSQALPDKEYSGSIGRVINFATSSIDMEGQPIGGYRAEVMIEGETDLLLGMTAKVEIITKEAEEALSVAYDSIITEDGKNYVYRAAKQGKDKYKVERIEVTKGDEGEYYTAIKSDRLREGDYIINYPEEVSEGDEINIFVSEDYEDISLNEEQ